MQLNTARDLKVSQASVSKWIQQCKVGLWEHAITTHTSAMNATPDTVMKRHHHHHHHHK